MTQKWRIRILRIVYFPAFLSVFLLGEHVWLWFAGMVVLTLLIALEKCKSCGARALQFGLSTGPDGYLICRSCVAAQSRRSPPI